ncbi:unnamed protein product [Owenia fusiformis]|uniref:Inositol-tetrakisphosphate 1-kinase n=1 Tax=Owenia fusiformis TaxID=6347 RepID=A0A8J1U5S0_OWEFU|nr:unnamed protein product [Owenia fusiformis]
MMNNANIKRVGFWINDLKYKKLGFEKFKTICWNSGLELVKIDLARSLEEQGPFDVIIQKLTDTILYEADQGDPKAQQKVCRFQEYICDHPDVIVIDPLNKTTQLSRNRYEMYSTLHDCASDITKLDTELLVPDFVELPTIDVTRNKAAIREANIGYPFVCKPRSADGSENSHTLCIIFNEEGLRDIRVPSVAQKLIKHNAVMYKVFVVGDIHHVVERPSLKNLKPGDYSSIFFHSRDVSKSTSCSFLTKLDIEDQNKALIKPDKMTLTKLVNKVQRKIGMCLFGIDVVIENDTGRYYVIDINYFPGYDGFPDFLQVLAEYILKRLHTKQMPQGRTD